MEAAATMLEGPRAPQQRTRREPELPDELDPGHAVGPWIVERIIGRGGMSTVYSVVHGEFGKRAALKLAKREVFGHRFTEQRFLLEARVVNAVDHPDVVDIFDAGTVEGRPYLVMEQLRGETLGERLERAPIPIDECCRILIRVSEILDKAHQAGVVHRDLKLDNVFLLEHEDRVKLIDWGLANIEGEDPLRDLIAGTPHYVAPEQVRGEAVTPASDVYSLGVLAYVLFLGRAPFDADSSSVILDQHLRQPVPAPKLRWPDIPAELEQVLMHMLEKEPEDRPTLAEVVAALDAARKPFSRVRPRRHKTSEPVVRAVGTPARPRHKSPPPLPRRDAARSMDVLLDPFGHTMMLVPAWSKRWWLGAAVATAMVAGGVAWRFATGM